MKANLHNLGPAFSNPPPPYSLIIHPKTKPHRQNFFLPSFPPPKMPPSLLLLLPLLLCCLSNSAAQSLGDTQIRILLNLKRSLGITDTTPGFESWYPSNSPCKFSGITCDSTGNITEIDLTNRGISGTLPFNSLCQLSNLSKLSTGSNHLYGNLTSDIRSCTNLKYLDLAFNAFTGEVPDLSPLVKLQVLNLSENGFTGPFPSAFLGNLTDLVKLLLGDNLFAPSPFPKELLGLTKLTWLFLSNCSIKGNIPPEIGNLKGLVNLELSDNYITGTIPPGITNLTNLWQLELYDNSLTGKLPAAFGTLTNLAFFDASQNRLEGNLSEIRTLTKLVSLQLFNNSFSGEVPQEIGDFKDLVNLSLYSNYLSGELPATLGSWAKFELIDVSTNNFTGKIPPDMCKQGGMRKLLVLQNNFVGEIPATYSNCTSLYRFRVSENKLSGEVPEGIWSLPKVHIIDLAMNNFTGRIATTIGNAKNLTQIYINDNHFSDNIPEEIGGAAELVTIDASSNQLSGEIPARIGELKRLSGLYLTSNMISGAIPASLGSCSSLNDVNLAGNALYGTIPSTLGDLPVLNSLNLSDNLLSGDIPTSLSSLRLSGLDLSNNRLTGEVPPALAIYGLSFGGNPGLCGNRISLIPSCSSISRRSADRLRTILSCFLAAFAVVLASLGCYLFIKKKKSASSSPSSRSRRSLTLRESWDLKSFRILTFDEQEIVNGITQENLIGKGGSGNVYRVGLGSGKTVAVKHIWNYPDPLTGGGNGSGAKMLERKGSVVSREFEAEAATLSSIRHVNVVKLYCSITSEDSSLLVYEYLPNGSLWDRLHGAAGGGGMDVKGGWGVLDWDTRYDVAVGAAKGLEYLHHGCERPILHRDVKSSNILLDESFKPRIADFGLAKIIQGVSGKDESTQVIAGTLGYIAPEYAYTYKVSEKSDVYSFGVVLMELVTGKRPIEPEFGENKDIVHWVSGKMTYREEVLSILDPRIPKELTEEAVKVLKVGVQCTTRLPSLRPSTRTVVQMLEEAGRWRSITAMVDVVKDPKKEGPEYSSFEAQSAKMKTSP